MPGCHLSIQREQDPNTSRWRKGTPVTSGDKILCAHPPRTSEGDPTPRPLTEAGGAAANTGAPLERRMGPMAQGRRAGVLCS